MSTVPTAAPSVPSDQLFSPNVSTRKMKVRAFGIVGLLSITFGLVMLLALLVDVLIRGLPWLDWGFLTSFDSRFAERAGFKAAIYGSVYMMVGTVVIALPLGVMAAIYLEEYAQNSRFARLIEVNIANLSGVPSIIYGLLGLQLFVRYFGFGRSVLAGSLTMSLLVLPLIIVAAREAIRSVPPSIREAALALGATRWQTVRHHVLPYAFSGIMTGNILAASRAIGEAAPLITIGALTYIAFTPDSPFDLFTVMPIQIFNWTSRPQQEFHDVAAAGILILLLVLLALNSLAIFLRYRTRVRY